MILGTRNIILILALREKKEYFHVGTLLKGPGYTFRLVKVRRSNLIIIKVPTILAMMSTIRDKH